MRYRLTIPRRHAVLASSAAIAASLPARLIGLLAHERLAEGEGLILPACRAVHTWFMRFPIDVVFVDRGWRVVGVHPRLRPWRLSAWVWRAWGVIEVAAGAAERCQVAFGDQLEAQPHPAVTVEGCLDTGCRVQV